MRRSTAAVGTALFFFIAPGTIAFLVPWLISGWRLSEPFSNYIAFRIVGIVLALVGLVALLDSFVRFVTQGFGTPAPVMPTEHLVVSGLYRYVRNPMYVGVVSIILGQALLFANPRVAIYGALVWLACHVFVCTYEEPTLREKYGREYAEFTANVPRWIPRLAPWSGSGVS